MNSSTPLVLAIDLGTTGPKVALVRSGGEIIRSAKRRIDTIWRPSGGAEQDAEQIWKVVLEISAHVIRESQVSADTVAGIALTSQFSSIVAVDRQGSPLMNLILWMDNRGAEGIATESFGKASAGRNPRFSSDDEPRSGHRPRAEG